MKAKSIIIPAAALLIGYAVGALLGFPSTTQGSGLGSIANADKFHKSIISPQMSAFAEKIKNDSTEMKKAVLSLTMLTSRMNEFSSLVDIAVIAAEGQDGLKSEVEGLKSLKILSENAANSGKIALASLDNIINGVGNPNAIDYEQASQNLTLAYLLVSRQMQSGKEFVGAVDRFLEGKSSDNYIDLAISRDLWANYCAGDAVMNGNKREVEYWKEAGNIIPADGLADAVGNMDASLSSAVSIDNVFLFNGAENNCATTVSTKKNSGANAGTPLTRVEETTFNKAIGEVGLSKDMTATIKSLGTSLGSASLDNLGIKESDKSGLFYGLVNAETYGF